MFWKVLFALWIIFSFISGFFATDLAELQMENSNWLFSSIEYAYLFLMILFFTCLLYGLGWKKKILNKKIVNIGLSLFISGIILSVLFTIPEFYSSIAEEVSIKVVQVITVLFSSGLYLAILLVFFWPFPLAVYKYKKNYESFSEDSKSFLKSVAISSIASLLGFLVSLCIDKETLLQLSLVDWAVILTFVYEIFYTYCFLVNKKVGSLSFWKFTACLYIPLTIASPFIVSPAINSAFNITSLKYNTLSSLFYYLVPFYILYLYIKELGTVKKEV